MKRRASIRLRLAVWYAATLLVCGGALLAVAYLVVSRSNSTYDAEVAAALRRGSQAQVAADLRAGRPPLPFVPPRSISHEERAIRRQAEAAARRHQRQTVLQDFLAALAGLALVSALVGWFIAGRALRPLTRITATAKRVTANRLGERIGLDGPRDELRELAETFDGMLDGLERAFVGQQRFIANASHELRTPLAVIRAELDATLANEAADAAELRRMAAVVDTAVERTEGLIAGLLTLARSEAPLTRSVAVDVAELVEAALDDLRQDIDECDVRLERRLDPGWVVGDPALLEGVVVNLLQNAVRYGVDGGVLELSTGQDDDRVFVEIANDGAAISAREAETLFEPFRRLEHSRSRASGGAGLGLSIARAAITAHGGEIEARPRPAGGLLVSVRLPAAAPAAAAASIAMG